MPALFPDPDDRNAPIERRMTQRLVEAVTAARQATERAAAGDDGAFEETVASGVSANLCEALVRIIEPFPTLDVGVSWARTRPVAATGTVARFGRADAALLREAARSLRERAPRPEVRLHGFVRLLKRGGGRRRRDDPSRDRHRRATPVGRSRSGTDGLRAGGSGSPGSGAGRAGGRSRTHGPAVEVAESAR